MRDIRMAAGAIWFMSILYNIKRALEGFDMPEGDEDPNPEINLNAEVRGQEYAIYTSLDTLFEGKEADYIDNELNHTPREAHIVHAACRCVSRCSYLKYRPSRFNCALS